MELLPIYKSVRHARKLTEYILLNSGSHDGNHTNLKFIADPKQTANYTTWIYFIFQEMRGLALSPDNNLYISNCWSHSILRVHKKSADTTLLADRK